MSSDNYTCCQLGGHLCQPLLHGSFKRFNNLHLVDLSSTSLKVVCTYVYSTTPKGAVCTNKHFSLTDQGAAGKIYRSNLKSKEILSSSLRRENSSLWFCPCPCPVFCPLFLPCYFCPCPVFCPLTWVHIKSQRLQQKLCLQWNDFQESIKRAMEA